MRVAALATVALGLCAGACAAAPSSGRPEAAAPSSEARADPYASRYKPPASPTVAIVNARLLVGDGTEIAAGALVIRGGRIAAVGDAAAIPADARVIDAAGRWVTPGIIDAHSHDGVGPIPDARAHDDSNELSGPLTAEVSAEHSLWPQDPGFRAARDGGVTSLMLLPGSANLFGGRAVIAKNVPARTAAGMKFPDAPGSVKLACGENPKRVYGAQRRQAPTTRMGEIALFRQNFLDAQRYAAEWRRYREEGGVAPRTDLRLATLVGLIDGSLRAQVHCFRADDMATMMNLTSEFGIRIAAFHHATEAYKIPDLLRERDICSVGWADWWGFKLEAWDGIRENAALVTAAGGCAVIASDSKIGGQWLNQEAAKAMAAGRRMGIDIGPAQAIMWLTSNPARVLGIDRQTGSLSVGKMADVVIWSRNPFSVYARADQVFIDGVLLVDRTAGRPAAPTDFELGALPR